MAALTEFKSRSFQKVTRMCVVKHLRAKIGQDAEGKLCDYDVLDSCDPFLSLLYPLLPIFAKLLYV